MNHKNEIIKTRTKGLGSSDAKMVLSVAQSGTFNKTAKQRIAQMLGIIERPQFSTKAMEYGNYIEEALHKFILLAHPGAVSNPYHHHEMLSDSADFSVFNHIDHEVETSSTITWFETKAVNATIEETLKTYQPQLQWHYLIGSNIAKKLNKKFKLFLAYYHTNNKEDDFDAHNVVFKEIMPDKTIADEIIIGLSIISKELPDFTYEYDPEESLVVDELPGNLQVEMLEIVQAKKFIDDLALREKKFKEKLYEALKTTNVKSIKTPEMIITKVDEGVTTRFNSAKFKNDYPGLHQEYSKKTKRAGYVKLTLKEERNNE